MVTTRRSMSTPVDTPRYGATSRGHRVRWMPLRQSDAPAHDRVSESSKRVPRRPECTSGQVSGELPHEHLGEVGWVRERNHVAGPVDDGAFGVGDIPDYHVADRAVHDGRR